MTTPKITYFQYNKSWLPVINRLFEKFHFIKIILMSSLYFLMIFHTFRCLSIQGTSTTSSFVWSKWAWPYGSPRFFGTAFNPRNYGYWIPESFSRNSINRRRLANLHLKRRQEMKRTMKPFWIKENAGYAMIQRKKNHLFSRAIVLETFPAFIMIASKGMNDS